VSQGDYVFSAGDDGSLVFVGDFEGLYRDVDDPWAQSIPDQRMGAYYVRARERLMAIVAATPVDAVAEVGCGLGQVCAMLRDAKLAQRVVGLDISETAIRKAAARHPGIAFHVADIRSGWPASAGGGFDVIIMNQMLWYVLAELDEVIARLVDAVRPGGRVIVAQAFLHGSQKYGHDVVDGFHGLLGFLTSHDLRSARVTHADLEARPGLPFDDGIVVLHRLAACT
jgi:SAM-dependent methyltransferase